MPGKYNLGVADYAICGIMLVVSTAIGLYFRLFGGPQTTNKEYLLAGKSMSIFPIAFSLMATLMSSTTLVGIPAEMYMYGTNMAFVNIGLLLAPIISWFLFLPIYHSTKVSTTYEYLDRRFGRTSQRILSGIFLFQNALFNGVVLYGPALSLSTVTDLSIYVSVISIGLICTFYCTFGGMKAILWADVFQSFLMYICLFAIVIKGCMDLGGMGNILKIAYDGGRIILPTFSMDFSTRYTIWSVSLQGIILTMFMYGANQIQVQRMLTAKNINISKMACLISAPMLVAFHLLCCMSGLIFYVYFKTCDPMTSPTQPIHSADQLMPLYIISAMQEYPGLPGLCIAGIFSATLSSVSSGINSMAAVTYEDIIRPLWPNLKSSAFITKSTSMFYGILFIILSFFVASMGNIVKASMMSLGMVSGPGLGLFLLAALTTTANEMGTNVGVLAGFLLCICLTFIPDAQHYPVLPVENNCTNSVEILLNFSTASKPHLNLNIYMNNSSLARTDAFSTDQPFPVQKNFPVSFMWISTLGLLATVTVGYITSWIVSFFRESGSVPSILLSPMRRRFLKESIEETTKDSFETQGMLSYSEGNVKEEIC